MFSSYDQNRSVTVWKRVSWTRRHPVWKIGKLCFSLQNYFNVSPQEGDQSLFMKLSQYWFVSNCRPTSVPYPVGLHVELVNLDTSNKWLFSIGLRGLTFLNSLEHVKRKHKRRRQLWVMLGKFFMWSSQLFGRLFCVDCDDSLHTSPFSWPRFSKPSLTRPI